jgi:hypothetical protein
MVKLFIKNSPQTFFQKEACGMKVKQANFLNNFEILKKK